MKTTHKLTLFLVVLTFFSPLFIAKSSFAIDSESDREAVVSARTRKFYKSSKTKQYLSLNGSRDSDYNSKDYELTSRYLYQSDKFINEVDFEHQVNYADRGTTPGKTVRVKNSELYDIALSSKARIGETKNYGVFYHRTIYDDMSKYYYDLQTAAGLGRMFFDEQLEFDLAIGYHDSKTYGHEMNVIPSYRLNLKITDKLKLVQRGYAFIDHELMDNELKTSLIYRISSKVSFEIRHTFEQRRYEEEHVKNKSDKTVNYVRRLTTIGLIFDLQ